MFSRNSETPKDEMARLVRVIAGTPVAGEKDATLVARAARRLKISKSRAKVFWYGETENIKSHEMDLARELGDIQPIQEAINACDKAESYLMGKVQRIRERRASLSARVHPTGVRAGYPTRSPRSEEYAERA